VTSDRINVPVQICRMEAKFLGSWKAVEEALKDMKPIIVRLRLEDWHLVVMLI
jgi:hypothetical protein